MHHRAEGYPRGKLRAVARNWATGRGGTIKEAEGDPLTTASASEIERRERKRSDSAPDIGPDEEDVVVLFLSLATQWRIDGMSGRRLGIDYAAVPPTAAMLAIATSPALLHDLRVMEAEALSAMAARR